LHVFFCSIYVIQIRRRRLCRRRRRRRRRLLLRKISILSHFVTLLYVVRFLKILIERSSKYAVCRGLNGVGSIEMNNIF